MKETPPPRTPIRPAGPAANDEDIKQGTPAHKPADKDDTSAAGEEDPGAAVEEMHDPHPERAKPGSAGGQPA